MLIWSVALILALASLPLWGSSNQLRTIVEFIYFLALGQLWNLLAGYSGLVSFGQQAWIGLGGYALIVFADDVGVNMYLAVILGGFLSALIAFPTAWLVFRLRGGYFAIGTWVVAEVFRLMIASSTKWLQGGFGRTLAAAGALDRSTRESLTYWFAVMVGAGSIALVYFIVRSRTGLGLTAIRDSETAAASLGVENTRLKLFVFVTAAFATSVVGGLIYINNIRITPDGAFSIQWAAFMAFIVVIGGLGTIEGPIVGAIIFFLIREYLSDFGAWSMILLGSIAVIMMIVAPEGLWGIIHRRFGIEIFAVRRRIPEELYEQNRSAELEAQTVDR